MSPLDGYNATDLLWLGDWSTGWIVTLAMLGVAVVALSIYDLTPLPPRRRWSLVALRAVVYAVAVMLLLEPAVDLKNVTKVKNRVAVLVDASQSMALDDGADATRWQTAQQAVQSLSLPESMEDDDHVYEVFTFGTTLQETTTDALQKAKPDEPTTDLSAALDRLRARYERVDIGGIVLVTDGTDTAAIGDRTRRDEKLDEATRELARSFGAPINTINASDDAELVDVAIRRVLRDDFAFVHNKVSVDVDVRVVGLDPTSFPVKLLRDGELLQTRDITVVDGESDYRVTFEYVPRSIGKEIYTIELTEFAGEVLLSNNRTHYLQKVIRDKIRALQVVGRPSWDERFLRRLLKRNPNVDLISFFILRTNENVQLAPTNEMSLIPFPTRELFEEELGSFDIVVFQNFNFGPYNMRQYLPEMADFVRAGGGFAMVGGDLSFGMGGYSGTPIEEILPVKLAPTRADTIDEAKFRPELTDAGQRHPITQLAFDPVSNDRIWGSLPAQHGTNLVMGPAEGATVLAVHPHLGSGRQKMPVIAVAERGEGRVMALTTDSSWRWGFEQLGSGGTPREYQMFWNSAIRWLIKDPELKLLRVELPDAGQEPGDPLSVEVRVQRADYTAAANVSGELVVSLRGIEDIGRKDAKLRSSQKYPFTTDADGRFTLEIPAEDPGVWTATARAKTEAGELHDEDVMLVLPASLEIRDVLPRSDLLQSLAEATEGNALGADEASSDALRLAPPRTVRVNKREVVQLWDSGWVFGLLVALLGVEWMLRRRWGRL